jgi:hypothetical protein
MMLAGKRGAAARYQLFSFSVCLVTARRSKASSHHTHAEPICRGSTRDTSQTGYFTAGTPFAEAMMMRVLILVVALTACNDSVDTSALTRAAASTDFTCPAHAIEVDEISRDGDDSVNVEDRATGCFQTALYSCSYANTPTGEEDGECDLAGTITSTTSSIAVNGLSFVPDGADMCHSGKSQEFFGVDLQTRSGDVLRIVQTPELAYEVIATTAYGAKSPTLASCATGTLTQDESGVSGNVTVDCTSGSWVVSGKVSFRSCN